MRKEILAVVASAVALVTVVARAQVGAVDDDRPHSEHPHAHAGVTYGAAGEQEKKQKYTCPMHPEVVMDLPGNCPKCGTKLAPMAEGEQSKSKHQSHMSHESHTMHDANGMKMPQHEHGGHEMHMEMNSSVNIGDPMSREGSGTSWLPDSSPMYGRMFMLDDDMLMLHGAIFPRYTNVSTRRGDDRVDAPNWIMAMFSHPLGDTTELGVRLMMSLDPLTEGGRA